MTVSIIIAVKTWQKNLEECVAKCKELDSSDFEIIILPDSTETVLEDSRIKVIPTGAITPPKKRDIGIKHARGQIIAFLDDDAYPLRDWLKNALENFKDEDVAAVGGPAVTPRDDSLKQKASGLICESFLVSANYLYRYLPLAKRQVYDYPTCNLLVRKSVLDEIGGFNTNFWPGEDTKLCRDITKRLSKKIIYDPKVLVYHHRREVFLPHLKQIANYGLHRGYFVKRFPENSLKIAYFIPSIFVLVILTGAVFSLFFPFLRWMYFLFLFTYVCLVLIVTAVGVLALKNQEIKSFSKARLIGMVFAGIILTHIAYGICFIRGLLSGKLPEEK